MEYVTERRKSVKQPENIWEIIHRGGYPELQDKEKEWGAFYADYVKTYMERDVRELAAVQDLNAFRQFMIAAAARCGEILNYSSIASEIGKDVGTVYYRGRDKKKVKENGETLEAEAEIDLIIEENGILYPIEIKKNTQAKAIMTSAFSVLDQIPGKKRGTGAVICNCPDVGALRENVLQVPVWYI